MRDDRAVSVVLLGRVGVVADGTFVAAGPPKQSAVFAVLALNAGRPVSHGLLTERVWDGERPPSGRGALYAYVSRLRALLAEVPDIRLLPSDNASYVLDVAPGRVDVHTMRRLVRDARRASAVRDDLATVRLLRSAVALWQADTAFCGIGNRWLECLRETLTWERLAAYTEIFRAELRAGRHSEVLAELSSLVADHPQAEHLVVLLMTALGRCGLTAEAVELYERTCRYLEEEYGCGPGAALQASYGSLPARARSTAL